jgi:hypothetical protein
MRGLTEIPDFGMLELEVHGRDAFGNGTELLPRHAPILHASALSGIPSQQEACICPLIQGLPSVTWLHARGHAPLVLFPS